jgi:hypothetical protein
MEKIVWSKSSDKRMDWNEAKVWCEEQGGRLPKLWELMKAYEEKEEGFMEHSYWSSTEYSITIAWTLNFSTGTTHNASKTLSLYVRCVFEEEKVKEIPQFEGTREALNNIKI